MDINNNIATNSDTFNRPYNIEGVPKVEAFTSTPTRPNSVTLAPYSVVSGYFGNPDNEQAYQRNVASLQNNYTNFHVQPNDNADIYVPVVCLVPLKRHGAEESLGRQSDLNANVLTENLNVPPTTQQNDARIIWSDNRQTTAPSLPRFTHPLSNSLFEHEMEGISTDTDITSSDPSQSMVLTDSTLGSSVQYSSGSTDNSNLFSSPFEDLVKFPIMDAPLDCLWDGTNAAIGEYSLRSSGNTPSVGGNLYNYRDISNQVAITTHTPIQPETLKILGEKTLLQTDENCVVENDSLEAVTQDTNIEENALATSTPRANMAGAMSKKFKGNSFLTEGGDNNSKFVKPPYCNFCLKNKEPAYLYKSHPLRSENGKVACPVLRNYVCPICGDSGDFAHTVNYCPANGKQLWYNPVQVGGQATEYPKMQLQSTSNNAIPSSSYSMNNEEAGGSSSNAAACSINQNQLIQSLLHSIENNLHSIFNDYNRSTSAEGVAHNRFGSTSPVAGVKKNKKVCKFCCRNKEPDYVYNNHQLRDKNGRIVCPYLRRFVCNICGATGDNAHTRKYCPQNTYDEFIEKFSIK